MDQFIKSFIIGASYPMSISFFYGVSRVDPNVINFDYQDYTMVAPIYLGLINAIGGLVFPNDPLRFFKTGFLSGCLIAILGPMLKTYHKTPEEWTRYRLYIIAKHTITFGLLMGGIEGILACT